MFQKLSSKRAYFILLLILLLALFLRLEGITWGLPSESHPNYSYHPDEGAAIFWATELYSGKIYPKQFQYGGTLFSSVVNASVKTARFFIKSLPGYNDYAKTLLFTRYVQVLIALISIGLIYAISIKLFDKQAALLAALLLSVTPGHVLWAQRLRVDELAAMMSLLILYLSIPMFKDAEVAFRRWALVGVCVGAAVALRAPLILFALGPVLAHIFARKDKVIAVLISKPFLYPSMIYCLTIVFSYLFFSPHTLLYFDYFVQGIMIQFQYQSGDTSQGMPVWLQYQTDLLSQGLGWPFYSLLVLSMFWLFWKRERSAVLIASTALPYVILTGFGSWLVVRYTLPLLPFAILLSTAFLHHLSQNKKIQNFVLPYAALLVILTVSFLLPYLALQANKNIRDKIHDWLLVNAPERSVILTLRGYDGDVYFEPIIPRSMQHQFIKASPDLACDRCYENWNNDYVILSKGLVDGMEKRQSAYPRKRLYNYYLWIKQTHELVTEFDDPPRWFGLSIRAMYSAHDLGYVAPTYNLYRKKQ